MHFCTCVCDEQYFNDDMKITLHRIEKSLNKISLIIPFNKFTDNSSSTRHPNTRIWRYYQISRVPRRFASAKIPDDVRCGQYFISCSCQEKELLGNIEKL